MKIVRDQPKKTPKFCRRDFLTRSAATLVTAWVGSPMGLRAGKAWSKEPQVTIERVDVFPMRYPMIGFFKFFTGPHASQGRAAVIVKLTSSDGTVGWGQSVPIARWSYETLETATLVLRDYFGPKLIGQNPLDMNAC